MTDALKIISELDPENKNMGLIIGKCYNYLWNFLELLTREGRFQVDSHTLEKLLKLNV